jgi:hypothetical protein
MMLKEQLNMEKKVKIYPLSEADNPPATTFVDLINVDFSNTIPYNDHFFEILNQFVQREPWLTRDMVMIDQLKSVGIEKGKAFHADARKQEILNVAIKDAHAWIDKKYEKIFTPPFYEGTNWALPASQDVVKAIMSNYLAPNIYPVDERAVSYSNGLF